jgi:hypothetical protein
MGTTSRQPAGKKEGRQDGGGNAGVDSWQSYMAHTTAIIAGLVHQFAAANEPMNDRRRRARP